MTSLHSRSQVSASFLQWTRDTGVVECTRDLAKRGCGCLVIDVFERMEVVGRTGSRMSRMWQEEDARFELMRQWFRTRNRLFTAFHQELAVLCAAELSLCELREVTHRRAIEEEWIARMKPFASFFWSRFGPALLASVVHSQRRQFALVWITEGFCRMELVHRCEVISLEAHRRSELGRQLFHKIRRLWSLESPERQQRRMSDVAEVARHRREGIHRRISLLRFELSLGVAATQLNDLLSSHSAATSRLWWREERERKRLMDHVHR